MIFFDLFLFHLTSKKPGRSKKNPRPSRPALPPGAAPGRPAGMHGPATGRPATAIDDTKNQKQKCQKWQLISIEPEVCCVIVLFDHCNICVLCFGIASMRKSVVTLTGRLSRCRWTVLVSQRPPQRPGVDVNNAGLETMFFEVLRRG